MGRHGHPFAGSQLCAAGSLLRLSGQLTRQNVTDQLRLGNRWQRTKVMQLAALPERHLQFGRPSMI